MSELRLNRISETQNWPRAPNRRRNSKPRYRHGSANHDLLDYQLNVNVKGVIWTVQKALPLMGPGGSIILNASVVATKGFANWSVYSATKAAVRNFARTWSSDLRGKNIRVNAISPGVIPTPGHEKTGLGPEVVASFMEYAASITPLVPYRPTLDTFCAKIRCD
jgi:NAD(P)-dependent dehydrogenase (short-subunit alcohol dehydrogenase family)